MLYHAVLLSWIKSAHIVGVSMGMGSSSDSSMMRANCMDMSTSERALAGCLHATMAVKSGACVRFAFSNALRGTLARINVIPLIIL